MYNLFNIFKKIYLLLKSLLKLIELKIIYGANIDLNPINSLRGKLSIDLAKKSKLKIGKFLMITGPVYIKCIDDAICNIGNNVFFNHNCSITCLKKVIIKDNTCFGNNVVIVDHNHKIGLLGLESGFDKDDVCIGSNVWVGANVTILKGVSIGDGSVIASGAVVNKDIPPYELWGGVPATFIKKFSSD